MAATTVVNSSAVPGASVESLVTVTLDASYPNPAGYVFTAASFGLTVLRKVVFSAFTTLLGARNEAVIIPTYNSDGQTLASVAIHMVISTTGAEVANAVDVHTTAFSLIVGGN